MKDEMFEYHTKGMLAAMLLNYKRIMLGENADPPVPLDTIEAYMNDPIIHSFVDAAYAAIDNIVRRMTVGSQSNTRTTQNGKSKSTPQS